MRTFFVEEANLTDEYVSASCLEQNGPAVFFSNALQLHVEQAIFSQANARFPAVCTVTAFTAPEKRIRAYFSSVVVTQEHCGCTNSVEASDTDREGGWCHDCESLPETSDRGLREVEWCYDCRSSYQFSCRANLVTLKIREESLRKIPRLNITLLAILVELEVVSLSPTTGFVQTPGNDRGMYYWYGMDSWQHVRPPSDHVTLLSMRKFDLHGRDSVEVFAGGTTRADMVWKTRFWSKMMPQRVDAQPIHARFRSDDYLRSGVHFILHLGFQLLYSFHPSRLGPSLVGEHLWNCSVSEWPRFRLHFICNLDRECEGGEDESGSVCPMYSGRCGQRRMTLDNKCYLYVHGPDAGYTTWRTSNLYCQKRGGYLASLNTRAEWQAVVAVLGLARTSRTVYIGMTVAGSRMPIMYKGSFVWADKTIAYYTQGEQTTRLTNSQCMTFETGSAQWGLLECDSRYSTDFLCELDSPRQSDERPRALRIPVPLNNGSLSVPVVRCRAGHVTHTFLACDEPSACWWAEKGYHGRDDLPGSWGVPTESTCPAPVTPLPAMFTCDSGAQRAPYSVVCDHRRHCTDGSDESFCVFPPCSGSSPLQCARSVQCLPLSAICDGQNDCLGDTDETQCGSGSHGWVSTVPPPGVINFVNTNKIVVTMNTASTQHPYVITPLNRGDAFFPCPETHLQCPHDGYCLPVFVRCNGINDCPGREDEAGCDSDVSCPGFYRCRSSSVCLHPRHVCDGVYQCPQHDDELACHVPCPESCTCHGLGFTCHRSFPAEPHAELRYLDASGSGLTPARLRESTLLIHLGLSRCALRTLHNVTFPNLRSLDLSDNELPTISADRLAGAPNLQYLSLSGNPLKLPFSPYSEPLSFASSVIMLDLSGVKMRRLNTHSLLPFPGLRKLNLSNCDIDGIVNEFTNVTGALRVLDIVGCPVTQFPPGLLSGLNHLAAVRADNFKLCCSEVLPPGFNPANCRAEFDAISSCESLLRSDAYRVSISAFSSLALLGNLGCFLTRILLRSGASAFGVFVTHLSFSDFLMGVYLAVIGVADRLYDSSYLWEEESWKRSAPCVLSGFLSMLSNEVSAFIICLITLDRFLVLRFPFSSLRFEPRSAQVACAMVWLAGVTMAAVPLMPMTSHWSFYSYTGICIPLPVSRKDFAGYHYAFGVLIVFNFVLFVFIALGQAAIYVSIRANMMSTADSTKKSNDLRIARRLITVAVSDFLCWFPIGLVGLLASRGVPIPGEVNVGMAIFVLPLNSAINPFIYTMNVLLERRGRSRDERLLKQLMERLCGEDHSERSQHS